LTKRCSGKISKHDKTRFSTWPWRRGRGLPLSSVPATKNVVCSAFRGVIARVPAVERGAPPFPATACLSLPSIVWPASRSLCGLKPNFVVKCSKRRWTSTRFRISCSRGGYSLRRRSTSSSSSRKTLTKKRPRALSTEALAASTEPRGKSERSRARSFFVSLCGACSSDSYGIKITLRCCPR
jgi:hypothetical protein